MKSLILIVLLIAAPALADDDWKRRIEEYDQRQRLEELRREQDNQRQQIEELRRRQNAQREKPSWQTQPFGRGLGSPYGRR